MSSLIGLEVLRSAQVSNCTWRVHTVAGKKEKKKQKQQQPPQKRVERRRHLPLSSGALTWRVRSICKGSSLKAKRANADWRAGLEEGEQRRSAETEVEVQQPEGGGVNVLPVNR